MAWYKPGRNPDHPGDPPPKWATLSRAGRLVLLGTVIIGVVIALIIIATRTAGATDGADATTVASEPSPPSWTGGQRVEVPEAGFAVTLAGDWVVQLAEKQSDLPILVVAPPELFGPKVELQPLLVAEGPDMQQRDRFTLCTLVRYAPIDITADEFMNETFRQSDWAVVESLHEGLSRVLLDPFSTGRILTRIPEAIYVDHYAIGGDNAVAFLWCTGMASHRGDWLSIAESFEFLPEEK